MSKKTLYDVLQVSRLADQDVIEVACQRLLQKLQDDGSQDSQNQVKFIKHAYDILSDSNKRAVYDQKLANEEMAPQLAASQPDQYRSDFDDTSDGWWKSPKVTVIILISAALIGFKLFTGHTDVKSKVEIIKESEATKRQANELNAANVAKHFDNEGALVQGVVENQSKYIDASENVTNRAIDVARQAEDRRRTELEYRANVGSQMLEMQRQEQAARLEMQRKRQAANEQQMADQIAQRERNYYVCLNAAIDRYGAEKAQSMCRR